MLSLTKMIKMLLNWNTINTCFLSSSFQVRSSAGFLAVCICSFLVVVFLEFLRRLQRRLDHHFRQKHTLLQPDTDIKELQRLSDVQPLVERSAIREQLGRKKRNVWDWQSAVEQLARGAVHMVQFAISYCVMLLVMYSNGKSWILRFDLDIASC